VTTPAAFKKAMQQLTTTIVKAERAVPDSNERAQLQEEIRAQLETLLATHAELASSGASNERSHQGWFEKTVARARVVLAPDN
jgi:F0F1-type ATP synthase membrane subunit b/b'